jgi:6-pyruvoyltetrahydropterin/6-carboxytetrahydropterin synthase
MPAKSRRPAAQPKSRPTPASRSLPGVVFVTRREHFNAAHRLDNPDFDQAWNLERFGKCNNPRWHGHNYLLEVTVKGRPDPLTGYVIELGELKRIMHEAVVSKCDHRNLNEEVDFLRDVLPSTENLVIAFWNEIAPRLTAGELHSVRLFETERNYAEYLGPKMG